MKSLVGAYFNGKKIIEDDGEFIRLDDGAIHANKEYYAHRRCSRGFS